MTVKILTTWRYRIIEIFQPNKRHLNQNEKKDGKQD